MKKILSIIFIALISSVTQAVNLLPQANLKVSSARTEMGQEVVLDATDSLNPQGQKHGLQYRFKPHQNTPWSDFSYQPIFKYFPTETGNEVAYLEVRDTEKGYRNLTVRHYRVIEPQAKNAKIITLNNGAVHIGEEVFFQLVFSVPRNTDLLNIKSRWDFDGDGTFETNFQNTQTIAYVYSKAGNFRPQAEILFPSGETMTVKGFQPERIQNTRMRTHANDYGRLRVNLAQINAPIVNLSPSYKVYNENTPIKFDASKTSTTEHSWVEFQFDGEATITDQKVITKTFSSPGKHLVITRHCFNRSTPICAETSTEVEVQKNPTDFRVDFHVYDVTGYNVQSYHPNQNTKTFTAGKKLRFLANIQNLSPQAHRFEYRWDFDGDGNFDTPFSRKNYAEYQYPRAGNFQVCVQVKNEFTKEDEALVSNHQVLKIQNNEKPYGFFTIRKLYKNPNEDPLNPQVFVGDRVQIVPTLHDKNQYNPHLKIRFDIDGDGFWETDFNHSHGFAWQFLESGDYRSTMQIKDANGAVQTIYQTFTVYENPAPQIKITVSKKRVNRGETIAFNAQKSIGNQLRYTWSIPNNYSPQNSVLAQTTARFDTPGQKMIELTITDSYGESKWVRFPVWVE